MAPGLPSVNPVKDPPIAKLGSQRGQTPLTSTLCKASNEDGPLFLFQIAISKAILGLARLERHERGSTQRAPHQLETAPFHPYDSIWLWIQQTVNIASYRRGFYMSRVEDLNAVNSERLSR